MSLSNKDEQMRVRAAIAAASRLVEAGMAPAKALQLVAGTYAVPALELATAWRARTGTSK